jgi:hypothetical protein
MMALDGFTAANLQPRLMTAASTNLALLEDALATVALQPRPDERWLQGHHSTKVWASDLYATLRMPVVALHHSQR